MDSLITRARTLWTVCAATEVAFPDGDALTVAVSPKSNMCPDGWVGLVVIGGAAIATAPTPEAADTVRRALTGMPIADLIDGQAVLTALNPQRALGPTTLAYLDEPDFRPAGTRPHPAIEQTSVDDPALRELDKSVAQHESEEAGILEVGSPVFVLREDESDRILAACGYCTWPADFAHLAVLTAPDARGRGLAKAVGTAATRHAIGNGLTPQWRARVTASQHVARALGYRELGTQISLLLH